MKKRKEPDTTEPERVEPASTKQLINLELWMEFRHLVVDKYHGASHGTVKVELNRAIKNRIDAMKAGKKRASFTPPPEDSERTPVKMLVDADLWVELRTLVMAEKGKLHGEVTKEIERAIAEHIPVLKKETGQK